jgi:hypothetical protein
MFPKHLLLNQLLISQVNEDHYEAVYRWLYEHGRAHCSDLSADRITITEVSNTLNLAKCSRTIKITKIFRVHSHCSVDTDTIKLLFVREHTILSPAKKTALSSIFNIIPVSFCIKAKLIQCLIKQAPRHGNLWGVEVQLHHFWPL